MERMGFLMPIRQRIAYTPGVQVPACTVLHQPISAATVYRYHHWPGNDNVPLSAALWSDSQWTRTVLGRRAFSVRPCDVERFLLLLCVLTLSTNNWKLAGSRALTESVLDDILRLFILRYANARIQSINQFICQVDIRQSKYNEQCMVAGQQGS